MYFHGKVRNLLSLSDPSSKNKDRHPSLEINSFPVDIGFVLIGTFEDKDCKFGSELGK